MRKPTVPKTRRHAAARPNRKPSTAICRLLANNLVRLRTARGFTQKELAVACGLTKTYIGNVEQACVNLSLANLEALTVGLNCSPVDLLSRPLSPVEKPGPAAVTPGFSTERVKRS